MQAIGNKSILAAQCLIWGLICSSPAMAQPKTTPRTGIIDMAAVVDARTEAGLNNWLLELEKKTHAQLKVLTVDTTHGMDIHQYALETAQRWRLGKAGQDNGALVVIAVSDRKYAIVTGEGIEDTLPDLYCDTIARKYFVPNFKRGDYAAGIYQGTVALARKIAGDSGVQLSGTPPAPSGGSARRSRRGGVSCFSVLIVFILFSSIFGGRRRRAYGAWSGGGMLQGMLLGSLMSGMFRGGGGSWTGGGSGSGFGGFGGGFGGGGGGSFGGGGASGGW